MSRAKCSDTYRTLLFGRPHSCVHHLWLWEETRDVEFVDVAAGSVERKENEGTLFVLPLFTCPRFWTNIDS